MRLVSFVQVGIVRIEHGDALPPSQTRDVVRMLTLVGGADIEHFRGSAIGTSLAQEDAGSAVWRNLSMPDGKEYKGKDCAEEDEFVEPHSDIMTRKAKTSDTIECNLSFRSTR